MSKPFKMQPNDTFILGQNPAGQPVSMSIEAFEDLEATMPAVDLKAELSKNYVTALDPDVARYLDACIGDV